MQRQMSTASPTVRRINKLQELSGAQTYLEIGVYGGDTFNALNFKRKAGVDPNFRFDTTSYAKESILFFSKTSDDFFRSDANGHEFDIIFIDGLHTYDQAFKDFTSALMHSHERTIFIIDDVLPIDSYSAMRNQEFAYYSRRAETSGSPEASTIGYDWHGDVYRILPFIRYFFPKLEFSTIIGSGNPQLVIWNESAFMQADGCMSKPFVSYKDDRYLRLLIESLDKLDYDYFMNNARDILQESQEDQLFEYLGKLYNFYPGETIKSITRR